MKKKTEVAVISHETISPVAAFNPEVLLGQAIAKGLPVETIKEFLNMRKELKAEYAKEQFDLAMSAFQGDCPIIQKKKKGAETKSGKVAYMYAPLEAIIEQVKPILQKHGFSYRFKTENSPDRVKVSCFATHQAGHTEVSEMDTSLGTKTDVMSQPQVIAATVTFNKRYAFTNAFGITTADADLDSMKPAAPPKETAEQCKVCTGGWMKPGTGPNGEKMLVCSNYTKQDANGGHLCSNMRLVVVAQTTDSKRTEMEALMAKSKAPAPTEAPVAVMEPPKPSEPQKVTMMTLIEEYKQSAASAANSDELDELVQKATQDTRLTSPSWMSGIMGIMQARRTEIISKPPVGE